MKSYIITTKEKIEKDLRELTHLELLEAIMFHKHKRALKEKQYQEKRCNILDIDSQIDKLIEEKSKLEIECNKELSSFNKLQEILDCMSQIRENNLKASKFMNVWSQLEEECPEETEQFEIKDNKYAKIN